MENFTVLWDDIIATDDLEIERNCLEKAGITNYKIERISNKDPEKFIEQAREADGICAYFPMGAEAFRKMDRCKIIAAPALGVDPYDLEAATEAGICVCNAPAYCIEEVATHTVALVLDCVRRVSRLDRRMRTGVWDWEERGTQHRLKARTYGLVSFGNIPRRVVAMMEGFEMDFVTYDPFITNEMMKESGVRRAESLKELFEQSDIISVHTPYNAHTRHMIGEEQFTNIKDGTLFVVTGRGGVVDEVALKKAILSGKIPAAALDVIEDEVYFKSVLFGMPQVVITPHCGYYSEESTQELRETNVTQIIEVLSKRTLPRYLVNKLVASKARFLK